ncbi:thiamine biosynthesis lipoprotein [Balneicella halophila]|uniref:FAD:protein FMN transferase n=1 Tax=Balneicella halophila TaxID=1537566 RepID=A0A7L4UMM3_BALHA|nr:FAD:protein FMN transferase [Balneicella halophila]PVX49392.1 thiamine biosynthesis lipoprotein [Balneicella halophila]
MQEKSSKKILFTIVATCVLILIAYGIRQFVLNDTKKYYYQSGKVFGTFYHLSYESEVDHQDAIDSLFVFFDFSLSTYNKNSIISKVNANKDVKLDDYFIHVFNESMRCSKETGGAFDITVTPLVDAWGFGSGEKYEHLEQEIIDSLMQYVGLDKVKLKDGKIIKANPKIQFNVNAIAKGYGVDVIADYLEEQGVKNYLVEIGGEIRALGENRKHHTWRTAINQPIDDSTQMNNDLQDEIVLMSSGGMATSGNYRNFYIKDGQKFSHTINPKTGYPVSHNLLSATVCMPTCLEADALATAFMVLGLEDGKALAEKLQVPVYFIYEQDGKNLVYMSEDFKERIQK